MSLSWNCSWSDGADRGSAGGPGLCSQKKVKLDGDTAQQLTQHAQYAFHALNAKHAKRAKLQVKKRGTRKSGRVGGSDLILLSYDLFRAVFNFVFLIPFRNGVSSNAPKANGTTTTMNSEAVSLMIFML